MAPDPSRTLYINDIAISTFLISSGITYTITNTGITLSNNISWTYSGSGTFLGFSTTEDDTTPLSDLEVGDTGLFGNSHLGIDSNYHWYSVASVPSVVTVTYGNSTVGTLTQLGQKMRIPSTTLTQDGFVYYLDDIKIECNPTSGNQIRCSYWDPYQSGYADMFATEDAVTQILDVADQLALGPIMITYEEVPATTFTIDGTTYDVDANTVYWYDWTESAYAPSGSSIEYDELNDRYYVHLGGTASNYGIFYNGSLQSPGDEIVVGRAYTTGAAYQPINLTGTTWLFPSSYSDMNMPWDEESWSINFISNNTNYTAINTYAWELDYNSTAVLAPSGGPPAWSNQNYRTIAITGGSDVGSISLYRFLNANATQTGGVVSFTIAGVTYWTPENTTWQTWYSSYLDTGDFRLYSATSKLPERIAKSSWEPGECVMYNDTVVGKTETVVAGRAYVKGNALSGPVINI